MRLLYVSQYFPPEMGAPAARVSELSARFAARGHDVTVLTGFPHHPTGVVPPEYRGQLFRRERWRGVRVVRSYVYATRNKGRVRRSVSYLSFAASAATIGHRLAPPCDLVIGTSPQFLCAVSAHAIAVQRRVPFVFEVRDLWPASIVEVGALPASSPIVKGLTLIEEQLYRRAALIVVVTDAFKARLIERGVPAQKIAVVKNGADLDLFTESADAIRVEERARLGYTEDDFVAAYIGTHGMAHGLDALLQAADRLRDEPRIKILLVGEGAEKARLVERAAALRLPNVRFLDPLPRARIPALLAATDLNLVLLRKTDLFRTTIPSKIFESMAAERPIALGVDGEAREIVEAAGAGLFVTPEDPAAIADGIRRLLAQPDQGRALGKSGRRYVEKHFSRDALAERYLEILASIA